MAGEYIMTMTTQENPVAVVRVPGPQGPAGNTNVVVSPTNPNLAIPGIWVQTFQDGSFTFWIEDGV